MYSTYQPIQKTTLWYTKEVTYFFFFSIFFCKYKKYQPFRFYRMGELEPWMDEQFITRLWFSLNTNVIVKVIRDKITL